jgi:hypothetical protein
MISTFPTIKEETTAVRRALERRRIYLASSWRNEQQPRVLATLRAAGHEVYDFRNPAPGNTGFGWRQAGDVSAPGPYLETLRSPVAAEGFRLDKRGMDWADTCVLLLPCGRSAHLEAGYMAGEGKDVFVLISPDKFEPELMYLLCTAVTDSEAELLRMLGASGLTLPVFPEGECQHGTPFRYACDECDAPSGGAPAADEPGAAGKALAIIEHGEKQGWTADQIAAELAGVGLDSVADSMGYSLTDEAGVAPTDGGQHGD